MADADTYRIELASIYGVRTKQGIVELVITPEGGTPIKIQMNLDKAREVQGMLSAAIEAAVTDELLVKFLTERIGLGEDSATRALLDFREMRQGSRGVVHPH